MLRLGLMLGALGWANRLLILRPTQGWYADFVHPPAPNRPVPWQAGPATPQTPVSARPPNIVVMLADDLGEAGVKDLLAQTINAAANLKLIERSQPSEVIVDPTVSPKAVAYPNDSRLLATARAGLVEAAKAQGIALKQAYAKEGASLRFKAGRSAHAKQFKRMHGVIRRRRTIVSRLQRSIQTRVKTLTQAIRERLTKASRRAEPAVLPRQRAQIQLLADFHHDTRQVIRRQPLDFTDGGSR
jgi:hypothetical protein